MYKNFGADDISTAQGSIEEDVQLSSILAYNYKNLESHFVSSSISYPYYSIITDRKDFATATKLLTIAYGMHTASTLYAYTQASAIDHKSKIYRLYAKALLGDETARFVINNQPQNEMLFISLARNQIKDAIKPNTTFIGILNDTNIQLDATSSLGATPVQYYSDVNNKSEPAVFPGGPAGSLYVADSNLLVKSGSVGLLFYEHGTAALIPHKAILTSSASLFSASTTYPMALFSGNNNLLWGFSAKLFAFDYTNTSRPQVTFFKCTAEKEEFNYSSNPSYKIDSGEIVVNSGSANQNLRPVTYITQIALCNDLGQILAVAKPTVPIKKDGTKKLEINVRLVT